MFCFVVKKMHPENCTDASTQNRRDKQSLFRNPPLVHLRLPLIQPEQQEGDQIHQNQIDQEKLKIFH